MTTEILTAVGSVLGFLLSVNIYFFKQTVTTLNEIKLTLMKLTTEHDANSILLSKHDNEIDKINEKIHKLEGTLPTIVQYLENHEKDK